MKRPHWTEGELKIAQQLMARKATNEECLAILGRSRHVCYVKTERWKDRSFKLGFRKPRVEPPQERAPEHVLQEAARRMSAPRTITGLICGDPPKGYSALEQRS